MDKEFWHSLIPRVLRGGWFKRVSTIEELRSFAATRSAFIAQKTLYNYLKVRIGTRFPSMFSDDVYIESVDIAKMHVYAACLSDLSIHVVAKGFENAGLSNEMLCSLAQGCFNKGIDDNASAAPDKFSAEKARNAFETRLISVDWNGIARTADIFVASQKALVRWAPIADELKKHDDEFVGNSIRFAWRDIRREFERRLNRKALVIAAKSLQRH